MSEQEVTALRTENDQPRRTMADRALVDQPCGMVMVLLQMHRALRRALRRLHAADRR
ncbi:MULTISPECIES: hypothetical protein [unclassified Streptomyces]|uniref:MarR family transcriptional regulator n=1 Tax=Streptomyces sp. NBC_00060 TaxID=2975636 RepID=A0AAU2GW80_9ACTN